ncbi:hypothetical protein TL16_g11680 [Triparma laevis f. inornata]|uniref:Uncharacterized protein n=1 Tax=Triparma laevis f. inornata TaxID=1714386 RepID=A0A9W7BLL5_9STRA|nr:hypothetical protein TL16_g11680 [Triparma laevis f. inornata]
MEFPLSSDAVESMALSSLEKYNIPPPTPKQEDEEKKEQETMGSYLNYLNVEVQGRTVIGRSGMTSGGSVYFWTHRSTTSDVISTINTTTAIGPDGQPESGRIDPATLRMERGNFSGPSSIIGRGVGGINGFKVSSYQSPLETIQAMSRDEHERMNKALMDERTEFLTKVKRKVREREIKERTNVLILQKIARGYIVRTSMLDRLKKKLNVRAKIAQQMKDAFPGLITTKKQFVDEKKAREYQAAISIANCWRRYASMMKVEAIRQAVYTKLLDDSAAMIQKLQRAKMGKRTAQTERERREQQKFHQGAGMLQRHYRGFLARKEVGERRKARDENAVRVLQRGARGFVAKQKVKELKQDKYRREGNQAALVLTRFFRSIYNDSRGMRIRNITKKFIRESSCVKIQCAGRRMTAYKRVKRNLFMLKHSRRLCAIIHIQRIVRGFLGKCRAVIREEEVSEISEIFSKVRSGDEDGVEHFITFQDEKSDERAMPNDVDHNGDTVLAIAATKGLLNVMRKCLVWGTDPNLKNADGLTAIDIAVRRFQPVAAEYLLSKIAVKFATEGLTLLHEASTSGMGRFTASLLENGVNANCKEPINGKTPMHDACCAALPENKIFFDHQNEEDSDFDEDEQATFATKHATVVKHLLEAGGDPTLRDNAGYTPMHYASMVGNVACIENIIASSKGKEALQAKDSKGKTPWVIACLFGHTRSANTLWEASSEFDNILERVFDEDASRFAVGLTTPDTVTPKTYRKKLQAVEKFDSKARAEKIQKLVTWAKFSVDSKAEDGTTALMMASKNGNFAAFETCIKMGAGLSRQDNEGRNVSLYLCGSHDMPAAVEMLKTVQTGFEDSPASLNIDLDGALSMRDNLGRSAIHYAAYRSNQDVVTMLHGLQLARCNIHSKDLNGDTPLHFIYSINENTFKKKLKLLGYGAQMDQYVVPPSDNIIASTIRLLRKLGASAETENLEKRSPVMVAAYEGNINAIKVLLADWKDMANVSKQLVHGAHYAILGGQLESLKAITKHEKFTAAHAHSTGPDGVSLLGTAIKGRMMELVNYLVTEVGINPTKQCWSGGGNGLHACALWGTSEIIKLFIKHPKIVPVMYERKNSKEETPLLAAVAAKNYPVCIELIKRGSLTTTAGKMWCASFLLSACLTQHREGKASMPKSMVWRGKKFFIYGIEDDPDIGDIATDTKAETPRSNKRTMRSGTKKSVKPSMAVSMGGGSGGGSKPGSAKSGGVRSTKNSPRPKNSPAATLERKLRGSGGKKATKFS